MTKVISHSQLVHDQSHQFLGKLSEIKGFDTPCSTRSSSPNKLCGVCSEGFSPQAKGVPTKKISN